ncbi:MAG: hypothetical protein ACLGHY_15400, partial [Gammaproteobacteria bacterium]
LIFFGWGLLLAVTSVFAAPRLQAVFGTIPSVLGALLLVGTFVTAAGPHSGDADTPRLAVGVEAMAQLHADLLFAYLGLLVGLGFALRAVAAPAPLQRRYAELDAAPEAVAEALRLGRERASAYARPRLDAATRAVGLCG